MYKKVRPVLFAVVAWIVLYVIEEIIFQSTPVIADTRCWVSSNGNPFVYDTVCMWARMACMILYDTRLVTIFVAGILLAHQFLKNNTWIKAVGFFMAVWVYPYGFVKTLYSIQYWIRNFGVWVFVAIVIFLVIVSFDRMNKNLLDKAWKYLTESN